MPTIFAYFASVLLACSGFLNCSLCQAPAPTSLLGNGAGIDDNGLVPRGGATSSGRLRVAVCRITTCGRLRPFANGLIERMDVKESEANSAHTPSAAFSMH